MNKQEYHEYLRSLEWKDRRDDKLWEAGYRCSMCGADGYDVRLEVHHLTYERVGHERSEDLMVLCRACHEKRHSKEWADIERRVEATVQKIRAEVAAEKQSDNRFVYGKDTIAMHQEVMRQRGKAHEEAENNDVLTETSRNHTRQD